MNKQKREDFLVTALEGGSNDWYHLPHLSMVGGDKKQPLPERIFNAILAGKTLPELELENPKEKLGDLSWDSIIKGEVKMKEEHPSLYYDATSDDWEATTADVWLQYAVMGEIVFG